MSEMRLVVLGAAGRMGRMLVRAVAETPGCRLVGALGRPGSEAVGADAGVLAGLGPLGVALTSDDETVLAQADGILDFTAPAASVAMARVAAERGLVHVIGTTGLSAADLAALREASGRARIVQSGNMSLGVNVLAALVAKAAAILGPEWDIEILEMHHRQKVDAPSGTALLLGEAAAAGRGIKLAEHAIRARDGHTGARRPGDIGFAALRGGTVVGDHVVVLAGGGERIELAHRAEDRSLYAAGAVKAALFARDRPPGSYTMTDVLGLGDV